MNRTVSESDGSNSIGRRFSSRSVSSSGSAARVGVGSPPVKAESAEPNGWDTNGRRSSVAKKKQSQDRLHMRSQYSLDSGTGSADFEPPQTPTDAAVGATAAPAKEKSLQSIWRRTVNKLTRRTSKSKSDEPPVETVERKTSSAVSPIDEVAVAGEIDPVYSFLKLTSVMPRQGTTTVIPGQGHRCCPGSKVDDDSVDYSRLVDESTYTHSNDPTKCQCPCHLPERLEACHTAWKKAFSIKNS